MQNQFAYPTLKKAIDALLSAQRTNLPQRMRNSLHRIALLQQKPLLRLIIPGAAVSIVTSWFLGGVALTADAQPWNVQVITPARADFLLDSLWGIQVATTSVALPILTFVIGASKDRPFSVAPASAVFAGKSYVFPIFVTALFMTGRIAVDKYWFSSPANAVLDLLLFVGLLGLVAFAYFRVVRLMIRDDEFDAAATDFQKEIMRESVLASAKRRVGTNYMLRRMKEIEFEYMPAQTLQTAAVRIRHDKVGLLTDVKFQPLGQLVSYLRERRAINRPGPTSLHEPDQPLAWFTKAYEEEVSANDPVILAIDTGQYAPLELPFIESLSRRAFVVGAERDE